MSAYRDAREALEAIGANACQEVTAQAADRLDPSAFGFVVEAVDRCAAQVHAATLEATALAVEGVGASEVVAQWEARFSAAQQRLSDTVGAAVLLSGLGGDAL